MSSILYEFTQVTETIIRFVIDDITICKAG